MGNDKGHAVVKLCLQEHTNYYFDCKPAALHGALDRFSQFFVAPLCKADALEREVNAVDNEFSGALPVGRAAVLHVLHCKVHGNQWASAMMQDQVAQVIRHSALQPVCLGALLAIAHRKEAEQLCSETCLKSSVTLLPVQECSRTTGPGWHSCAATPPRRATPTGSSPGATAGAWSSCLPAAASTSAQRLCSTTSEVLPSAACGASRPVKIMPLVSTWRCTRTLSVLSGLLQH